VKILTVFLLAITFSACGQAQIKPDPSLPAVEANYPTAEFYACGQHFHGLGICRVDPSQSLDQIDFKIQGYYQGTIRVYSTNSTSTCDFDEVISYVGNQLISVSIPGIASPGCTVGFVVSPSYPNQENQDIVVRSFVGFLRIRGVETKTSWHGDVIGVVESGKAKISIPTSDAGQVSVAVEGCGISVRKTVTISAAAVNFTLDDLGIASFPRNCVLEGVILGKQQIVFSEFVSIYSKNFVPLAVPAISVAAGKIYINADDAVSVLSLDDLFTIDSSWSVSFDSTEPHILRALTAAGRSVIGDYDPLTQRWTWK
jgi:hypothetical protein